MKSRVKCLGKGHSICYLQGKSTQGVKNERKVIGYPGINLFPNTIEGFGKKLQARVGVRIEDGKSGTLPLPSFLIL